MKKNLLFIAIAGLFTSMASAADLYVRDNGAGNSYPTISAAITAAVDGDRIIIRPKAANLPYIENLVINKSLSFVSEINFTKYVLQGTVSITSETGRVVTINNMSSVAAIAVSGPTVTGRTTLNVFNSFFNVVNANMYNTTLNMSGCIVTTYINASYGRITANTCNGLVVESTNADPDVPTNSMIEVIANRVTTGITIKQYSHPVKVLNNYVSAGPVTILRVKNNSMNEIRNNVISNGTYSAVYIDLPAAIHATFGVLNNVLIATTASSNYAEVDNENLQTATVYAHNNISTSPFTTINTVSAEGNIGSQTLNLNNSTNTVTGASITDNGNADDEYADLDLSRNDVGNFGGSDSWANYWPANVGNKPQVNYLNTPRRIYTGTTEMEATGAANTK